MRVHWTPEAIASLDEIRAYHALFSETLADRWASRILSRSEQLVRFPMSGRVVPEREAERLRQIFAGPFRILYVVGDEQIDIILVIHGARMLE